MANIQTAPNGQVVRGEKSPEQTLANLLQRMAPEMAKALPKHISPDRMNRIALTALRANPQLGQCTPASFLGCVLSAAQLGLEPNTPLAQCFLIPRRNKGVMECTLQLGYQGLMELARRSGEVASIYAEAVYPGDHFEWTLGLDRTLVHRPSSEDGREDKQLTHVYAVAKLKSGDALFVVLTRNQVERYKKRGAGGPAWQSDFAAMAQKTAIRRLFTFIPRSSELAGAVAMDEAVEIGKPQVVAFDPSVTAALESHGVEVARYDTDGVTENQDALEEQHMREPGDD